MALKHLELEEMVALTNPWVGNSGALIGAVSEVAGLHPQIKAAHAGVVAVQASADGGDPVVVAISREEAEVDDMHDNAVRAVWYGTTAAAAFASAHGPKGAADAKRWLALRDRLLPDGLQATQRSYLGEAGAARKVSAALNDEIRGELESISVGAGGTVAAAVALWCRHGARLGELERQKSAAGAAVTPTGIFAARNQWISVVSTVLGILELSTAPADAIEAIRRQIVEASERAAARYAMDKSEPAAPSTPPAPAAPPASDG
jgi:hypothetical protein